MCRVTSAFESETHRLTWWLTRCRRCLTAFPTSRLSAGYLTPTLERLGFDLDDWTFPLIVDRLDDSIAAGDVDPVKWYLAAND